MIGIYGGTFDPIHYGHLRTALEVKQQWQLEQVRMVPSYQPPHRELPSVTGQQRYEMLQLALQGSRDLIADDRELKRGGASYMVDTLQSFRLEMSEQPIFLIIGSDAFDKLTSWHQWQSLFEYANLVVMTRPGKRIETKAMHPFLQERWLPGQQGSRLQPAGGIYFQPVTQLDISATQIRAIITNHGNAKYLLPDAVLDYIHNQGLYRELPRNTDNQVN